MIFCLKYSVHCHAEDDLNEKVQSDPSTNEGKCDHCSRVQRKMLGIHVDRMTKVQCEQQNQEDNDDIDRKFPEDNAKR